MKVTKTKLHGVLLITLEPFEDHRGVYIETFNKDKYAQIFREQGIEDLEFVRDDSCISGKHVLRGIHGDAKTWKLATCLKGKVYSVIVNCDEDSENFGQWEGFILSDKNRHQLLIPNKFGNSFLVLSDIAVYHYKQSTYYDPKNLPEFSYKWNDPKFNITWPIDNPILSERDSR